MDNINLEKKQKRKYIKKVKIVEDKPKEKERKDIIVVFK
jgi:hypothetical protein